MTDDAAPRVLIVGAGLAGSLMACYLARAGWRVSVYERRPDPRAAGYVGGRSINLALSARGLAGLRGVELDEVVLANDAIRMPGRMIHPARAGADLAFQPYSKDPNDAIHSVSRGGLNLTLLNAADAHENVSLHFDHACLDVDVEAPAAVFQAPGGETARVEADLVIGADGAYSAVRSRLQRTDRFDYSQSYLQHGYKELHIPPAPGGGYALEPHALHIWPRGASMMIALPNLDGSFTCTLFWPYEGPHSFANLRTPDDVLAFFKQHYPDAVPLMPTLVDDYFRNPTSSLVTVRCWPWQHDGKVVLIGDAAHAIVPFYGQGMNAAFEDCLVLAECLAEGAEARRRESTKDSEPEGEAGAHSGTTRLRASVPSCPDEQREALEKFQHARKPNADAIADMAIDNFVEMRDKVGDPDFLYRKQVEQALHGMFPDRVFPQYNLVSFSTVPYTEAQRRGRELEAVLQRIMARLPRESAAGLADEDWKEQLRVLAQEEL